MTDNINVVIGLAVGLEELTNCQRTVSSLVDGAVTNGVMSEQVRMAFLAEMVELVELLQELEWKPWPHKHARFRPDKIVKEFGDVLAFLGLIMVYLSKMGIDSRMLAEGYVERSENNVKRFDKKGD
jgi:NTP pyrophosphatase (non-canonical NTP hydrolase)